MTQFYSTNGPISIDLIKKSEKELSVKLPSSYVKFVQQNDGASLEDNLFIYYDIAWKDYECTSAAGFFEHSLSPILDTSEFVRTNKALMDPTYFKNIIAFMSDPGGDCICFDYRNGWDNMDPPVVYWNHEAPENENISPIAKNFDEFLSMLMSEEEAEKELERLRNEPRQE